MLYYTQGKIKEVEDKDPSYTELYNINDMINLRESQTIY